MMRRIIRVKMMETMMIMVGSSPARKSHHIFRDVHSAMRFEFSVVAVGEILVVDVVDSI